MPWATSPPPAAPAEPRSGGAPFWDYCQHKPNGFQSESFEVAKGGGKLAPLDPPGGLAPLAPP